MQLELRQASKVEHTGNVLVEQNGGLTDGIRMWTPEEASHSRLLDGDPQSSRRCQHGSGYSRLEPRRDGLVDGRVDDNPDIAF
jgi:hypothetical protein